MSPKSNVLVRFCVPWALVAALGLASGDAHAQSAANGAVAQALFDEARKLMGQGRFADACAKFEESQRLDPGAGTLLNLAICYERDGRTASAWSTFREAGAVARTAGKPDRVKMARDRANALEARLPRLTIQVTSGQTPGLEVRRDGDVIRAPQWNSPIAADPGVHTVTASAPGRKPWKTTVTLRDGVSEAVLVPELEVADAPATAKTPAASAPSGPPSHAARPVPAESESSGGVQRGIAVATGVVGFVGLGVGTFFAARSKSAHDDAQPFCNGPACTDQRGVDLLEGAIRDGNIATGALVIGTLGVAAGAVLWFTAPSGSAQVGVGPGTVQIAGRW